MIIILKRTVLIKLLCEKGLFKGRKFECVPLFQTLRDSGVSLFSKNMRNVYSTFVMTYWRSRFVWHVYLQVRLHFVIYTKKSPRKLSKITYELLYSFLGEASPWKGNRLECSRNAENIAKVWKQRIQFAKKTPPLSCSNLCLPYVWWKARKTYDFVYVHKIVRHLRLWRNVRDLKLPDKYLRAVHHNESLNRSNLRYLEW